MRATGAAAAAEERGREEGVRQGRRSDQGGGGGRTEKSGRRQTLFAAFSGKKLWRRAPWLSCWRTALASWAGPFTVFLFLFSFFFFSFRFSFSFLFCLFACCRLSIHDVVDSTCPKVIDGGSVACGSTCPKVIDAQLNG